MKENKLHYYQTFDNEVNARRKWNTILKICEERKPKQKVLYPVRLTQIVVNMQQLGEYCSHGLLLKCLLEIKSSTEIRETWINTETGGKYEIYNTILVELRLNEGLKREIIICKDYMICQPRSPNFNKSKMCSGIPGNRCVCKVNKNRFLRNSTLYILHAAYHVKYLCLKGLRCTFFISCFS